MKIGIYGYGNLGKGVELAARMHEDIELVGIFTRRDPASVKPLTNAKVYGAEALSRFKEEIDCLIVCGGSATDLPKLTPALASDFNLIDSFDTHKNIPAHFESTDAAAREGGHVAMISVGWDPGMFSLNRMLAGAILPEGMDYTFWGKGVSQGHSDAVRRIEGVLDARQYTVPVQSAIDAVRGGQMPTLTTREKHTRECFVVAAEGADLSRIEKEIKEMPNYFADYDTTVHFIGEEEMKREHSELPHGGCVIRVGKTGKNGEHTQVIEYNLALDSNPEFTASVIVAYARAVVHLFREGQSGAKTVFDVPPAYLSPLSREDLMRTLL